MAMTYRRAFLLAAVAIGLASLTAVVVNQTRNAEHRETSEARAARPAPTAAGTIAPACSAQPSKS
ncbi:MAG: hypothetical protein JW888_18510, partial [Pirellulales bacterium]|nr:hypothetical protein [Pirellulales bacterium]